MRFHKIAEEPKLNTETQERHRYSELDVVNEALREYLFQLSIEPDRNIYTKRDKAHVALKILYRVEEHHKHARDGRPNYPVFSWALVENFAKTPPFTYIEYSTPHLGRGGLGKSSNSEGTPYPTPVEEAEK